MAAVLLPVKILIIVDSGSAPAYFPSSLKTLSLNELVLLLGIACLASYAIHKLVDALQPGMRMMAHRSLASVTEAESARPGLDSILLSTPKEQRKILSVSTDMIFSLVGLIGIAFIFPLVFWLYILALALILTQVAFLLRLKQLQATAWSQVRRGPAVMIAFLVSVGAVIASALLSDGPNLLVMMLSLLFLRQGLGAFIKSGETVAKVRSGDMHAT